MKVLIITGGSKGIGKAIAEKYHEEKFNVVSIARTKATDVHYRQLTADLSNPQEVTQIIQQIFSEIDTNRVTSITLVNNAGSLGEINIMGTLDATDISRTLQLNCITPSILANEFIRHTNTLTCKKQLVNISSGAAVKPYFGWSLYCSSKAALDMATKTIAAEQDDVENGVKTVGIYPGVVETNMQIKIRETPETNFKNVQRFIALKDQNELYTPSYVAQRIYEIDSSNFLKNGDIIDLRKL